MPRSLLRYRGTDGSDQPLRLTIGTWVAIASLATTITLSSVGGLIYIREKIVEIETSNNVKNFEQDKALTTLRSDSKELKVDIIHRLDDLKADIRELRPLRK